MVLSADFFGLILYCVQQLGVTLGVGSQTILLVAYLISMRDGILDSKEAQFSRAVRAVLNTGLMCIVISGVGITFMHILAGEGTTVLAPAYLFKWLLIILALGLTLISKDSTKSLLYGVAGGTWYALFLVHILAPVTTWSNLFTLYVVWLVGFILCWEALTFLMRDRAGRPKPQVVTAVKAPVKEAPQKIIPPALPVMPKKEFSPIPPPIPKKEIPPTPSNLPTQEAPVIIPNRIVSPSNVVVSNSNTLPLQKDPLPTTPMVSQKDAPLTPRSPEKVPNDAASGLPTIQVMPKTPNDLQT